MYEDAATENIEIRLFLEAIYLRCGYDFRRYSEGSMRRRVRRAATKFHCSLVELQEKLLHESDFIDRLLPELTVPTTEMFRDPQVFAALAEEVLPVLKTYPSVKIWHAGCSTGEEVYSMAILLKEEGLYDRSLIYATDINPVALRTASKGVYSAESARIYTRNYHAAKRKKEFSEYYYADYGSIVMNPDLKKNIVFTDHNLLTDEVFSEVHLILCRNVLIYFERKCQQKVLDLFWRSLTYKGFLCLGTKEAIITSPEREKFLEIIPGKRVFQVVKALGDIQ